MSTIGSVPASSGDPMVPKIPFVIGVVGKIKLPGYAHDVSQPDRLAPAVRAVYEHVWKLLDWTFGVATLSASVPGAEVGGSRPVELFPAPLGLEHSPVVVLSSLAPGADTIVAEAAMDYAAHTGRDVSVRAPLPFPAAIYRDASTFCPSNEPGSWTARQRRFDALLARLRGQPGFSEERDLFCVGLHPELEGNPQDDLTGETPVGTRRHLRYRAAGEYIATSSHLLLAVYDEVAADEVARRQSAGASARGPNQALRALYDQCGTEVIVEAKRRGLSFQLLAVSNNFSWADNGPVLRIPIDTGTDGDLACDRPPVWLHPYDTQPRKRTEVGFFREVADALGIRRWKKPVDPPAAEALAESEPVDSDMDWQRDGHDLLRRMSLHLDRFNVLSPHPREKALLPSPAASEPQPADPDAAAMPLLRALIPLQRLRRRASERAIDLDERRSRLLSRLLLLILVSAGCLSAYEHWNPGLRAWSHSETDGVKEDQAPAGSDTTKVDTATRHSHSGRDYAALGSDSATVATTASHGRSSSPGRASTFPIQAYNGVRRALLSICLFSLAMIGMLYWRYRRSGAERERYDLRAMAEGLRVQIAWSTAGLPNSVAADYMQRQRGELDWIRRAIQVATIPVESRTRKFSGLPVPVQASLLDRARESWVREQIKYFRKTASIAAVNHSLFRQLGWSIAAAALLNVFAKWLCAVQPNIHDWIENQAAMVCAASFLLGTVVVLLGGVLRRRQRRQGKASTDEGDLPPRSPAVWLLARPFLWGTALMIAIVPLGLPHLLAHLVSASPDVHNWWMILTGTTLAGGLLCLAWSERNFHAEDARRYRAMAHLFECADRRLGNRGPRGETAGLIDQYRQSGDLRVLSEIHDILYQLGKDALDENAEWLILRRTHPLEPFMAG